jgi:hypothetical protein
MTPPVWTELTTSRRASCLNNFATALAKAAATPVLIALLNVLSHTSLTPEGKTMKGRLLAFAAVALGLTLPVDVARTVSGNVQLVPNDACADMLCGTYPNKYCGSQANKKEALEQ